MADSLRGGIVINEILADPNGSNNFDTDGSGGANSTDEYVEFFNDSNAAIDLAGLQLWDKGKGLWFTFPPNSTLLPGAHALVMTSVQQYGSLPTGSAGDLFFDASQGNPVINNGGDNIVLYDPSADQFIQASFNGVGIDDPTSSSSGYTNFSSTATRVGVGEDFGNDADGFSIQREGDGQDNFVVGTPNPGATNICFANGTLIDSGSGWVPVEDIQVGDDLRTLDNGIKPVLWVSSKHWSASDIINCPDLAPVEISTGALGPGWPTSALRVSRQHRVMVRGKIAMRMFGTPEVLVPTKALLSTPGVSTVCPEDGVTYFHFMFDQHELVLANGLPAESYYLGKLSIAALSASARNEIETILQLSLEDILLGEQQLVPVRPFVESVKARRLIERHLKNNRPFLT